MFQQRGTAGARRLALFTVWLALIVAAAGTSAASIDEAGVERILEIFGEVAGPEAAVCWSGVVRPIESGVPALDVALGAQEGCGFMIDLYTFEASEDETLLVELYGRPRSLLVGLLDESFEVLGGAFTSDLGEAAIAMILPATATYTIAVMGEAAPGEARTYSLYMDAAYDLFRPCYEEKDILLRAGQAVELDITVEPRALPDYCRGFESYLHVYGEAGRELVVRVEGASHDVGWLWIDSLDRRPIPELVVERDEVFGERVAYGRVTPSETGFYVLGIAWWVNAVEGDWDRRYWVELYSPVEVPVSPYLPAASVRGLISLDNYAAAPLDMQQYYLAGIWDGVWALVNEIAYIESSETPPAIPSHAPPLTEEEWRGKDRTSRSDLAHDLVMWKLMTVLGEGGPVSGANMQDLTAMIASGLETEPPFETPETMALIAWALLTRGEAEPVGPSSTGAGGFWHVEPFARPEPEYVHAYLLGVLDGWLAVGSEMETIRDSNEPPLLPADSAPISAEEWVTAAEEDRASLAGRLAVWRFGAAMSDRGEVDIDLLQEVLWERVGPAWAWDEALRRASAALLFWEGLVLTHPLNEF